MYLSLFSGVFARDWKPERCMLTFRGGHVAAIADVLRARGIDTGEGLKVGADGGEHLLIEDPDGRPVFFDTTPSDRLYEDASS